MVKNLILGIVNRSDFLYRLLRTLWPIAVIVRGKIRFAVVSRYDDVREVLLAKEFLRVPYAEKIRVIRGVKIFSWERMTTRSVPTKSR